MPLYILESNQTGPFLLIHVTPNFARELQGFKKYAIRYGSLFKQQLTGTPSGQPSAIAQRTKWVSSLTPEDFYVLLQKVRHVYAGGDASKHLLPDNGIFSFMEHCSKRIGDTYFRTPRTTITSFVNLLAVLEQNAGTQWEALLGGIEIASDGGGSADVAVDDDEELASFKL